EVWQVVQKVRLPQHNIGSDIGCKRSVVLEHAVVGGVGDVEVAGGVRRNPPRITQVVCGGIASLGVGIAPGRGGAAALPEHQIGGGAVRKRRVVFEDAAIEVVGDVE